MPTPACLTIIGSNPAPFSIKRLTEVRIDEYPGKVFHGKVIEMAPASGSRFALLPSDNATGNFTKVVQIIQVKIVFDDSNVAATLRPGLTVIATVRTRR